jgi:hypothetical protein
MSNYTQITLKKQNSLANVPSKVDIANDKSNWEDGAKKKTSSIPKQSTKNLLGKQEQDSLKLPQINHKKKT